MSKARTKRAGKAYVIERAAGFGLAAPDAPDAPAPDFSAMSEDELAEMDFDESEPASYVPVKAFADRDAAEAERDRLEAEVRAALPPALFLEWSGWEEAGGTKAVAAGLKALGLDPPKFGRREYDHGKEFRDWWAARAGDLTPELRAKVWGLFPKLQVYRVVERKLVG